MVHRGEIIERVVRSSGISLTQVAKRMGKSRSWLYDIFDVADLSLDYVIQFGKVLHYDFSEEIPQIANHRPLTGENALTYGENSVEYWKEKYYAILEEYHKLLMERKEQ